MKTEEEVREKVKKIEKDIFKLLDMPTKRSQREEINYLKQAKNVLGWVLGEKD